MISFRGKKHYPFTKLEKNSFHILQKSEVNKNWKDEWRSTGSLYKKEFWLDCLSITHNHDLRMILLATVSLACCFVDDEGMNKWCCPVPNYGRHWIDLSNHLLILLNKIKISQGLLSRFPEPGPIFALISILLRTKVGLVITPKRNSRSIINYHYFIVPELFKKISWSS